jgi:hypothetical protein
VGTVDILAAGDETCTELAGIELPLVDIDAEESLAAEREVVCCTEGAGDMVMALSGFKRCPESGPSPKRISARESGIVLLCHPWSD